MKDLSDKVCEELRDLQIYSDIEFAHAEADNILCGLLVALGYEDVVTEYNKIDKWYV